TIFSTGEYNDEPLIPYRLQLAFSRFLTGAPFDDAGAKCNRRKEYAQRAGARSCDQLSGRDTRKVSRFDQGPFSRAMEVQARSGPMVGRGGCGTHSYQ